MLDTIKSHMVKKSIDYSELKSKLKKALINENSDLEKSNLKNLVVGTAMAISGATIFPGAKKPKEHKVVYQHPHTKKYYHDKEMKNEIKDIDKYREQHVKKALTAGYGGSGAPGALTGGGVFQAESLEDGNKSKKSEMSDGIQYISCDNCGDEQVYMKHQVKCRSCKKNYSLDKLSSKF
jgi:hypothetical protein